MDGSNEGEERWLTPAEVADKFRVSSRTVWRWAMAGKIAYIRTPGGHRRYRESSINALMVEQR